MFLEVQVRTQSTVLSVHPKGIARWRTLLPPILGYQPQVQTPLCEVNLLIMSMLRSAQMSTHRLPCSKNGQGQSQITYCALASALARLLRTLPEALSALGCSLALPWTSYDMGNLPLPEEGRQADRQAGRQTQWLGTYCMPGIFTQESLSLVSIPLDLLLPTRLEWGNWDS